MWRSVPQTPQAPIRIKAALSGTFGQGTVWMLGLVPGPLKVATRTDFSVILFPSLIKADFTAFPPETYPQISSLFIHHDSY
jgi:hypothetical protein